MAVIAALFMMVILTLAAWVGGGTWALEQRRLIEQYVEMPGVMLRADTNWTGSDRYTVKVAYRYQTPKGEVFESEQLAALPMSGSLEWAQRMLAEHAPGQAVRVFVDPKEPKRAYLLRQTAFEPYLLVLAPMPLWTGLGYLLAQGGFFRRRPRAVLIGPVDWYRIEADHGIMMPVVGATLWVLAGLALGGGVAWHYFSMQPTGGVTTACLGLGIYGLLTILPLWEYRRIPGLLAVQPTDMTATLGRFQLERPIIVRCVQQFAGKLEVRTVRLILSCWRHEGLTAQRVSADAVELAANRALAAGQQLQIEYTFEVMRKDEEEEHKPFSRWEYPRLDWQLEVEIEPMSGPRISLVYPVEMEPGDAARHAPSEN